MDLLETWRKWADDNAKGQPPYVLDADKGSEMFRKPKANRLNLGLLPYPFIGDLENATIFVLMANPNAGPSVAYADRGWDKNKHIANLKQDFSDLELPLESLSRDPNPEDYWYRRLRRTIDRIGQGKSLSHGDAIELVAKNLAVIQRSPYWSTNFVDGVENLPSSQLAMDYVKKEIVLRVKNDNAVLIVGRRVRDWNKDSFLLDELGENERLITKANRFGSLNPNTAGGKAILRHFGIND
ncbi:MAG: hypothetical protein OXC55_08395 [Chloroflexi bacterium]|nr:hypothetical protein [Chloroflexota bacterium]